MIFTLKRQVKTPYCVRYLRNGGDKPDFDAPFIISDTVGAPTYDGLGSAVETHLKSAYPPILGFKAPK
jgi:hypothetical protein